MSHSGFKGTELRIERVELTQAPDDAVALECNIQFAAEDGTVHAIATHKLGLDLSLEAAQPTPHGTAARDLLRALVALLAPMHYTTPHEAAPSVLKGIAEALEDAPRSDEPGAQG